MRFRFREDNRRKVVPALSCWNAGILGARSFEQPGKELYYLLIGQRVLSENLISSDLLKGANFECKGRIFENFIQERNKFLLRSDLSHRMRLRKEYLVSR